MFILTTIDIPIFTFAAMLSFYHGYYAICQGPNHKRKLLIYQITQGLLCAAWFVFSILNAGPFDGWAKISILSDCGLGFSIFLAVLQSIIYLVTCFLGLFCIYKATKVSIHKVIILIRSTEKLPSVMTQFPATRMNQTTKETIEKEEL